jgi:hypothetical protein
MTGYDPDAILADPHAHPKHRAIAAINIGIRDRGEQWAKCHECGEPYQITDDWLCGEFCSDPCGLAFTADLLRSLR